VDVADIGFVRSSEGDIRGTASFDERKDLDGDDVIDSQDTQKLTDRWALEFPGAENCPECTPTPRRIGVKIRPVPDRAVIPAGGTLKIDIVAEGLDNMGGFEFGSKLTGNALNWNGAPTQNNELDNAATDLHPLGPVAYGNGGYRIGGWLSGAGTGPSGTVKLASVTVMASQDGESHLILSAPVIARMDGTEQAVMQTVEGIYFVGTTTQTPTPTTLVTPTPTMTQAPTRTFTPVPTATLTSVPPTNYDIWPPPTGDGKVDTRDLLEWMERIQSNQAEDRMMFDLARYWNRVLAQ